MGEILRAVLDQSCTFSAPAFYTMTFVPPAGAYPNFTSSVATLQMKQDRYFLCTAIMPMWAAKITGFSNNQYGDVQLYDPATSAVYFDGGDLSMFLVNETTNDQLTLNEYILFEPAQLLAAKFRGPGVPAGVLAYMVLVGIEYAK